MKLNFPDKIPVFPLSGVIFFPKTNLPLNIFEERYLDLVNDCVENNKLMGMIQAKKNSNEVYRVGCLGKIIDFQKSQDGRILINLSGVTRFEIKEEIKNNKLYREFVVDYNKYLLDVEEDEKIFLDHSKMNILYKKIKSFFKKNGLLLNWLEFSNLEQMQQINTLAMIAPISNEEKQKLLETLTLNDKVETLLNIVEFYLHENKLDSSTVQ
jgi:Lon protease-like protein